MPRRLTPNNALKARGSARVREELDPTSGSVEPTYALSHEGRRAWERICHEMDQLGILSPTYADFMTIAAGAIGDIEIASKDLASRGHIAITERGETKNPSFTIKTSAQNTALKYLCALGLSPTTIGKLVRPQQEEANQFEEL